MTDFNNKNIIYGWNYSGKTTLSRLFSFMENKKINSEDFPEFEFEIILENGTKIDQANIGAFPFNVRVSITDMKISIHNHMGYQIPLDIFEMEVT